MACRSFYLCIFLLLASMTVGMAQESSTVSTAGLRVAPVVSASSFSFPLSPVPIVTDEGTYMTDLPYIFPQVKEMPDIYKVADLALFCRWEVLMEKKATFPVKFRLGDVPTVDRLEGKRDW